MNWREMMDSFRNAQGDAVMLISHASYLFKTSGVFWAVDPRLNRDLHIQAEEGLAADFKGLQVAMVTHLHGDHYDKALIERLASQDIHWIFPHFMPAEVREEWKKKLRCCSFLAPGDEISLERLRIRAFESIHYDYFQGKRCGVEENGYRVEAGGKVFLFPGDVRNYEMLPDIQKGADEFFTHVWLGREAALSPKEEMAESFCRYFAGANAGRMWLGHLNDMDRAPIDRWTPAHAQLVKEGIQKRAPDMDIQIPEHGKVYCL